MGSAAATTPVIVSSRAFRNSQGTMKELAREQPVHITENGGTGFVFCSEEVFARETERRADEILYEREFEDVVARGMADVEEGRTFTGTPDEVMAEISRRAAARG